MIRAVLFDFDLTLADSRAGVTECVNHALRALGLAEAEPALIHRTIGLSLPRTLEMLTGTAEHPLTDAFSRRFAERADQVMVDRTVLYPEVRGVLATLRAREIRTAVVSTKFRYRIENTLARDGLLSEVEAIVGGQDVTRLKPDPEGLHLALEKLALPVTHAVYVGDHPVDAEAAGRAGLRFIGVLSGASAREEFAHPVERFLESLDELPDALATLAPAS